MSARFGLPHMTELRNLTATEKDPDEEIAWKHFLSSGCDLEVDRATM